MKLDRNGGRGKYAIVRLRKLADMTDPAEAHAAHAAIECLTALGLLEFGHPWTPDEFFVIRLRDEYAAVALAAYAGTAAHHDVEYAGEIMDLANRAGPASPFCKRPD